MFLTCPLSFFLQVLEEELQAGEHNIIIQHVGDITFSTQYCVLLDGSPVAETSSITMAVGVLVADLHVYYIEHPKGCKHLLSFVSSCVLGIKYEKGKHKNQKP